MVFVGRGGGRGAPTDIDEDLPFKLQLAEGGADDSSGPPPVRRFAASDGPAPTGSGSQEGGASWYHYKPGTCAHRATEGCNATDEIQADHRQNSADK